MFYRPELNSPRLGGSSRHTEKAGLILESWRAAGVPLDVRGFARLDPAELHRVHDPAHVAGVLAGTRLNGFNNRDAEVSMSGLWGVSATWAAAEWAARNRSLAVSLGCGGHHAMWSTSHSFSTFNGLLHAAHALLDSGLASRPCLLDLDRHFGDGTQEILGRLPGIAARVEHYSFSARCLLPQTHLQWASKPAARWLDGLGDDIRDAHERGCDFVLFYAGMDPHVDDPMGGFLTGDQLARRDRTVFETCRSLGLPLVAIPAGGYQYPYRRVLDLFDRMAAEALAAFG